MAGKLADANSVGDTLVGDSRAVETQVVDSPVDDRRVVDYPVAFLSLVDRACQVDLDLVVLELVDRACPALEAELDDRAYQDGQDSVDFRYLRRAGCRADRGARALSMVLQVESLRAAAPGEFPVETVAQAESRETFQVESAVPDASLGGWFLEALRPA